MAIGSIGLLPPLAIVDPIPPEPGGGRAQAPKPPETTPPMAAPEASKGYVLDAPEPQAVKWIVQRRHAQDVPMRNRNARWEVQRRRRAGDPWVRLRKVSENEDIWELYDPPGTANAPPVLAKTDDLCSKVVSTLLADPPRPDCEPSRGDEEAKSAAEFSTRLLSDLNSESSLNTTGLLRDAMEQACSSDSSFIHDFVDQNGGGYQPRQILASAAATTEADALWTVPAPVPPSVPGALPAINDPGTPPGGPVPPGITPPPPLEPVPQPQPYIVRYVTADGTLTDEPSEAAMQWLPSLKAEILHARHVRFLPPTCSGLAQAWGVIISGYCTLSRLKSLAGERWATFTPDQIRSMVSERPMHARDYLPGWACDTDEMRKPLPDTDVPPDDALAYYDCLYITGRGNPEYPEGAYAWVAAEKHLIVRGTWTERIAHDPNGPTIDDTPEPGSQPKQERFVTRPCDIPVIQVKQFVDPDKRDPYGRGLVGKLGDGDALINNMFGLIIEQMFSLNNPHLLVPIGSGINETQLAQPRGTPIYYNAVNGGRPVWESLPPMSDKPFTGIEMVGARMDSNSGLQQIAQGLEDPSVTSGVQAQSVVEQALKALAAPKQHMDDAFIRHQRVLMQLARRSFTMPQRLKITGAGGAYKAKEWTATDLGSTSDVKVLPGTSTMLTPSAKQALLSQEFAAQAISLEDYQRAKYGSLKLTTGMQDNPHRMRVATQIDDWEEGPADGWAPPQAPVDPMTGGPAVDPLTGAPLLPPLDPADPFPVGISDDDPAVAPIRYQELVRAASSAKYASKPPEWRALLDAAYLRARQAAGVLTVAEQAAQQQQAAAQAAAMQPGSAPSAPPAAATEPETAAALPPEGGMSGGVAGL